MAIPPQLFGLQPTSMSRLAVALRVCLLTAAWQGPIPWFHCHGTLANAPEAAKSWLAEHLKERHPSVTPYANVGFGWHFHCNFPGSPGDDPQQSPEDGRGYLPVLLSGDHADCSMRLVSGLSVLAGSALLDQTRVDCALQGGRPRSTRFFDAFAPTLALPLRFGVLNC